MPDGYGWIIAISVALVWYLSHQTGRLDRLHHRIEVAQGSLEAHLNRRAGISAEIVTLDFLDPASAAYLVQSAHDVLAGGELPDETRLADESQLTDALNQAFGDKADIAEYRSDPAINLLLDELLAACNRVTLAKRFHTEAVGDCLGLRSQLIVRYFRLAGFAALPSAIEFDDQTPFGLIT